MNPEDGINPEATDTKARQTLEQLNTRWGTPIELILESRKPPNVINISGMNHERWVMVGPSRGAATLYELEREP